MYSVQSFLANHIRLLIIKSQVKSHAFLIYNIGDLPCSFSTDTDQMIDMHVNILNALIQINNNNYYNIDKHLFCTTFYKMKNNNLYYDIYLHVYGQSIN